jgi:hypothetical protein
LWTTVLLLHSMKLAHAAAQDAVVFGDAKKVRPLEPG